MVLGHDAMVEKKLGKGKQTRGGGWSGDRPSETVLTKEPPKLADKESNPSEACYEKENTNGTIDTTLERYNLETNHTSQW